jgi:hypothetical protein
MRRYAIDMFVYFVCLFACLLVCLFACLFGMWCVGGQPCPPGSLACFTAGAPLAVLPIHDVGWVAVASRVIVSWCVGQIMGRSKNKAKNKRNPTGGGAEDNSKRQKTGASEGTSEHEDDNPAHMQLLRTLPFKYSLGGSPTCAKFKGDKRADCTSCAGHATEHQLISERATSSPLKLTSVILTLQLARRALTVLQTAGWCVCLFQVVKHAVSPVV